MKEVCFIDISKEIVKGIDDGKAVIGTTDENGNHDLMTIGWGAIGLLWKRPTLMLFVRESRHTRKNMDETGICSIAVAKEGFGKAFGICGSKSGRDTDKYEECGLTYVKGPTMNVPFVEEFDYHVEGKIMSRHFLEEKDIPEDVLEEFYTKGDYHFLYTVEILNAYEK